jgi:hypothetical protein
LPELENFQYIQEKKETKNIGKKKIIENKKIEKEEQNIEKEKQETKIISEKISFSQKLKDLIRKIISGLENSKSFKYKHEPESILNKRIYLPKPKIKLFLPKPKKEKKVVKKILDKVVLGPKE